MPDHAWRIMMRLRPHAMESVVCKRNHGPQVLSLLWCEDIDHTVLYIFDDHFVSHISVVPDPSDKPLSIRAYRNRWIVRKRASIANAFSGNVPDWVSVVVVTCFGNCRRTSCEQ